MNLEFIPPEITRSSMAETDQVTIASNTPGWKVVFIGPQGLRAGWRLLIFIALLAAFAIALNLSLGRVLHKLLGPTPSFTVTTVVISETLQFGIVLIATLIMARFERRSLAEYGL